jgi:hypothetical protein
MTQDGGEPQRPRSGAWRTIAVVVAAIVIVMVVVMAFILLAPTYQITATNEILAITVHNPDGSTKMEYHNLSINSANGNRPLGQDLVFTVSYTATDNDILNITMLRSETPGFAFVSCSPALPLTIPLHPNQVSIEMRFSAPSTFYSGNFTFMVFLDQYSPPS